MQEIRPTNSIFQSAGMGEAFATELTRALESSPLVHVDLSTVETMTPSFANAMVMTLLERFSLATLQSRCVFMNRSPHVIDVMNRAVLRYERGIRLSNQRPHAAAG